MNKKGLIIGVGLVLCLALLLGCTAPNGVDFNSALNGCEKDSNDGNLTGGKCGIGSNTNNESNSNNGFVNGGALAEMTALMKSVPSSYMVKFSTTAEGSFMTSMTKYTKGTSIRFDVETSGMGSRIYYSPSVSAVCYLGDSKAKWSCMENPPTTDQYQPYEYDKKIKDETIQGTTSIVKFDNKIILGMDTQCYGYVVPSGKNMFCFNSKGVLLYVESSLNNVNTLMEATEYSENVADSVFDLPAPLIKIN
jgi:hypothetical protein